MDRIRTVMIIGGGLGGLALCQALKASNIKATVYERDVSPVSREQGYHIGLNEDGARALASLNHPELRTLIVDEDKVTSFSILSKSLALIARIAFAPNTLHDVKPGIVDRIQLRQCLTHGIEDNIVWNKQFLRYEEFPDRVVAHFTDGTTAEADLLVGADGVNSAVRGQRCPSLVTEGVNIDSFVAVVKDPVESELPTLLGYTKDSMVRILGPKGHTILTFQYTRDGHKHLIWAMSHPRDNIIPSQTPLKEKEEELQKQYQEKAKLFHSEIQHLSKLPSEIIMIRELKAVKPTPHNPLLPSTRVTLLGDAAHAMTTHRGLGANTTFQDAVDLANVLKQGRSLSEYEKVLITRGFKAVKESRMVTDSIHSTGLRAWIVWFIFFTVGILSWLKKKIFFWK